MQITGSLGDRITALRLEKHISQQTLAGMLYVTQGTVSKWEKGLRYPDVNMIRRMAEHFGVDPVLLLSAPVSRDDAPAVILVEDEPVILDGFLRTLREALPGAEVSGFRTAAATLEHLSANRVDVAFLDIELYGESGLELARRLIRINPHVNIVFLTSHPEYSLAAFETFCSGYVLKPLTEEKIREQLLHLRFPVQGLSA